MDKARKEGGKTLSDAEARAAQLRDQAGSKLDAARQEANRNIDAFDKSVEKKAAEAKTGISSWFGGSK